MTNGAPGAGTGEPDETPLRVAVIGAGPAGLAAAWGLTEQLENGGPPAQVTVYEASWRAGGKCASTRLPPSHRVVQNGTHYMFGVYFNALRMVETAHQEIADPRFGGVHEFVPRTLVGLKHWLDDAWSNWILKVPPRGNAFPQPDPAPDFTPQSLQDVLVWLRDQLEAAGVLPSGVPLEEWLESADLEDLLALVPEAIAQAAAGLQAALDLLIQKAGEFASDPQNEALIQMLVKLLTWTRTLVRLLLGSSTEAKVIRVRILADFVLTVALGIFEDEILSGKIGDVDDWDFLDWLGKHGAQDETRKAPLTRSWYDVVAAYEDGDPEKPRLSAAAVLQTVLPAFLLYRGPYVNQLKPEVGEGFVAPIYEALSQRGVAFRFLHELREIAPDAEGAAIEKLVFGVPTLEGQAAGAAEAQLAGYKPLDTFTLADGTERVYWPPKPKPPFDFVGEIRIDRPLPYRPCRIDQDEVVRTVGGSEGDFDHVVFAIPHLLIPAVAPKLMAQSALWKNLATELPAVETKSVRLWLRTQFPDLEWDLNEMATRPVVTAYDPHFSTWEDSGQQLDLHTWSNDPPRSIATVFGPLKTKRYPYLSPLGEWLYEIVQRWRARNQAKEFLDGHVPGLWPGLIDQNGVFRWDELVPVESSNDPLKGQWIVANSGARERYTQASPGTFKFRLRSNETGYNRLSVAGDWTRFWPATANMELAVISGLRAAYDIRGANVKIPSEEGFFPSG